MISGWSSLKLIKWWWRVSTKRFCVAWIFSPSFFFLIWNGWNTTVPRDKVWDKFLMGHTIGIIDWINLWNKNRWCETDSYNIWIKATTKTRKRETSILGKFCVLYLSFFQDQGIQQNWTTWRWRPIYINENESLWKLECRYFRCKGRRDWHSGKKIRSLIYLITWFRSKNLQKKQNSCRKSAGAA